MAPSHGEPTEGVSQDLVVVLCTAPATQSETLARTLVEERLCACVNVVPAVRSFFRWEGKVDVADEHLLVIKTTSGGFLPLRDRLIEVHAYEVPQVVALPVSDVLPAYLSWVMRSVQP